MIPSCRLTQKIFVSLLIVLKATGCGENYTDLKKSDDSNVNVGVQFYNSRGPRFSNILQFENSGSTKV